MRFFEESFDTFSFHLPIKSLKEAIKQKRYHFIYGIFSLNLFPFPFIPLRFISVKPTLVSAKASTSPPGFSLVALLQQRIDV